LEYYDYSVNLHPTQLLNCPFNAISTKMSWAKAFPEHESLLEKSRMLNISYESSGVRLTCSIGCNIAKRLEGNLSSKW